MFLLIISIIVIAITTVIGLFLGHIILVESIGIAIAASCLVNHFFGIHPAFCLLIGIGVFFGLYAFMNSKIGFWLIGGFMSAVWGLLVALIVYDSTAKDMIWTYVSWGLATLIVLGLHFNAKNKLIE